MNCERRTGKMQTRFAKLPLTLYLTLTLKVRIRVRVRVRVGNLPLHRSHFAHPTNDTTLEKIGFSIYLLTFNMWRHLLN